MEQGIIISICLVIGMLSLNLWHLMRLYVLILDNAEKILRELRQITFHTKPQVELNLKPRPGGNQRLKPKIISDIEIDK